MNILKEQAFYDALNMRKWQETILVRFKKYMVAVVALLSVGLLMPQAFAQAELEAVKQTVNEEWSQSMPAFPEVSEVRETPIQGLYEVRIGSEIAYTDAQGQFLVIGEIMDLKTHRNLTQERLESLIEKIKFDELNLENAITIKRGNGERKLVVFEDPTCGFCHKFERELAVLDNITIYVYLYPILSGDSRALSASIWCSDDRQKAWEDWMRREVKPTAGSCDGANKVLDENLQMGRRYQISGTPALVFTDGSRIPGAVGPDVVEARFKEIATAK